MKKILVTIAALFLSAAAWAQYQGTTWGSDPEFFKMQKGLTPNKTQSGYKYCTEKKLMLGQPSELFYIFENNKLAGISYQVDYSPETEKKLLNNLEGFKYKQIETHKRNKEIEPEDKEKTQKWKELEKFEILFFEDLKVYSQGGVSIIKDLKDDRGLYKNNALYIYKYMDHTLIYIYSNILYNDKIVVVYIPQTEDF